MVRYTKQEVQAMFGRLIRNLVKTKGFASTESSYRLDYVAIYGGYVIEETREGSSGKWHPFGLTRRNAAEMYLSMWMVNCALEQSMYHVDWMPIADEGQA